MKKNTTLAGALHPILFFAGVYVVALFFSIFICSTIFYSLDSNNDLPAASAKTEVSPVVESTSYSNSMASLK